MHRTTALLVAALALAAPALAADAPAIAVLGKGVQIYVCTQSGTSTAWKLKAPEAILTDASGRRVGHHFAGPSWQAEDGSLVTGEPIVASPAPSAAIPWLVLRAKEHKGDGLFAKIAYIARTATEGGLAPTTGCDTAHLGAETRVDYTAAYTLFPG